jgi:hypothetical protein
MGKAQDLTNIASTINEDEIFKSGGYIFTAGRTEGGKIHGVLSLEGRAYHGFFEILDGSVSWDFDPSILNKIADSDEFIDLALNVISSCLDND